MSNQAGGTSVRRSAFAHAAAGMGRARKTRGRRLGSVPRPYDRKNWKALRVQIGMRDGWRCQVPEGDSICGAPARELDQIVPISRGGSWFDPSNLRMACHHHQRLQGGRLGAETSGWPAVVADGLPRSRRRRRGWVGAINLD